MQKFQRVKAPHLCISHKRRNFRKNAAFRVFCRERQIFSEKFLIFFKKAIPFSLEIVYNNARGNVYNSAKESNMVMKEIENYEH